MKLSSFGKQLSRDAGIVSLMEDLGDALNVNPDLLFLGGGNPANIPEFEARIAEHLCMVANNPKVLHKLIGVYQSPQGSEEFIAALVKYFRQELNWKLSERNVAITNGSQSAFFMLINMLAGSGTHHKQICLPMMPEYLGYADQGMAEGLFRGYRPTMELRDDRFFKYHVNFEALNLSENTAALCVSRPTNPTGNVLTDQELEQLVEVARAQGVPLIIDSAYGSPFPNLLYQHCASEWLQNTIMVMSLSKLGLPGARTGIVVADEETIQQLVKVNTIMSLANGNLGPVLMTSLLNRTELPTLCKNVLFPFYRQRRDFAVACIQNYFDGLPYRLHVPEGAFFLWLWLENLPISSTDLYQRLKQKGVLIMDGKHFFFGLDEPWDHAEQCVRLSYCQNENVLDKAIGLIGEELKTIYA